MASIFLGMVDTEGETRVDLLGPDRMHLGWAALPLVNEELTRVLPKGEI